MKPYSCDSTSTPNLALPTVNSVSREQSRQSSPSNSDFRPRNKRFGTVEQHLVSSGAASTSGSSRAISQTYKRNNSCSRVKLQSSNNEDEKCEGHRNYGSGLLDGSWASHGLNALQEIAFSLMVGASNSETRQAPAHKKEDWFGKGKGKGKVQTSWGPEVGLSQKEDLRVGTGSTNHREEKLKGKQKVRMLEAQYNVSTMIDETRNYKHRNSLEKIAKGDSEEDDFALVYVYHVQPQDTLQGVVLKFHSQIEVFKKANRFWAGDSIQVRDKVFLPVDSCAIKGKPYLAPQPKSPSKIDCVTPNSELEEPFFINNYNQTYRKSIEHSGSSENFVATENPDDNESDFTHVRWVLLDSMPSTPVEVVRIPRKILKYFPPRRRKSFTTASTTSTPRISSEIPSLYRTSIDSQTSSPPLRRSNVSVGPNPFQGAKILPLSNRISTSDRRGSVSEVADRLGWLRGPGGVGTLGKNVHKPGPAKDALNSWTRKQFPSIAIDSLPSTSAVSAESALLSVKSEEIGPNTAESISTSVPGNSNGSLVFPNMNLNNVETWVRKMATRVQMPKISREDVIEMLDGAGSDDGRNFESSGSKPSQLTPRLRVRGDGTETSVRDRGKSGKSE